MSNVVFDHKGHGFESLEEMCDWYHINQGIFLSRLDRGWTLEQALVTPVMENYRDYPKIKTIEYALKKDGSFYGEVKRRTGESEDSNPQVADVRRRGKPGPQYIWNQKYKNNRICRNLQCLALITFSKDIRLCLRFQVLTHDPGTPAKNHPCKQTSDCSISQPDPGR